MSDKLFNVSVKPQAQPLGSFVQAAQFNTPGAAQRPLLGQVAQISTIQRAGTSNVRGSDEMGKLAAALAPLNKNLTALAQAGIKQYAKGNIEQGYYDELKNQTVRMQYIHQEQQEAGAAEAADQQTALARVDPVAGEMFREANPWKAIGRRRALAQLAGGSIQSAMNVELVNSAGVLSGMKPGSPEAMQMKASITQGVLNRYGLTGNETESAVYVVPALNKAWDKFTEKHSKLYNAELVQSSIETTNYAVNARLQSIVLDGITLQNGSVLRPGMPGFGELAGVVMTMELDKGTSMLGGKDRVDVIAKIKESLGTLYGMDSPGIREAIGNIRLGSRNTPMEQRPKWMDANPMELTDYTTKGLDQVRKLDEAVQAEGSRNLEKAYLELMFDENGRPLDPNSAEAKEALEQLQSLGVSMDVRDTAEVIGKLQKDTEDLFTQSNAPSFDSVAGFELGMMDLRPGDIDTPEKEAAVIEAIKSNAAAQPTLEGKQKVFADGLKALKAKKALFAKMPAGAALEGELSRFTKEAMMAPELAKLKPATQGRGIFGGITIQGGSSPDGQKYQQASNDIRGLYRREISNQFTAFFQQNPNVSDPSQAQIQEIYDLAGKAVQASEPYKALVTEVTKKPEPRVQSDGTPVTNIPRVKPETQRITPQPRDASPTIKPEQARQYQKQAVMNDYWIRSEMELILKGKPTSKQLYDLSVSAGTSTDRMLLEQLKFYPESLDPTGKFRQYLQKKIDKTRQSETPAAANLDAAIDPMGNQSYQRRSPGSWLMSMLVPPARASVLPVTASYSQSSTKNVRGTWTTPSGFEILQYVTGDVTAPHDGGAVIVDPKGHGGGAYHNHYEFATVAGRKRAAALFRSLGFRVTSEVRPGDPDSHGVGRGLDVAPPLDLPYTVAAEAKWSRRANAVLGFNP